jgi:DNA-binding GntR family transcriptional regulator
MLDEMAAGPGVERYLELNLRFHSELYELAGRPRLVEMIETLRDASSAYLHIYATRDFPSERLDAEHREILAACRERQPRRAAEAVRHHLRQTVEHVARRLEGDA